MWRKNIPRHGSSTVFFSNLDVFYSKLSLWFLKNPHFWWNLIPKKRFCDSFPFQEIYNLIYIYSLLPRLSFWFVCENPHGEEGKAKPFNISESFVSYRIGLSNLRPAKSLSYICWINERMKPEYTLSWSFDSIHPLLLLIWWSLIIKLLKKSYKTPLNVLHHAARFL